MTLDKRILNFDFVTPDRLGRNIGARVQCWQKAGYFCWQGQQTRDGIEYGPEGMVHVCTTAELRQEQVEQYLMTSRRLASRPYRHG